MSQDTFIGWLRQSTTVTVNLGIFVDVTDGFTEETGLAAAMVVKASKNGAAHATRSSGTAITHDTGADGNYLVELDTTDTNTAGRLKLTVQLVGTHRPKTFVAGILEEQVWDSLYSTERLQTDVREFAGDAPSATAMGLGVPTNFADLAIVVTTGAMTMGTSTDKTGYTIAGTIQDLDTLKNFDPATQTVDLGKIAGNTQAATNLKHAASSMTTFTCTGGGHSTTLINTDLTEATADHYAGRYVYGSIAGALLGEASLITAYNGSTKALTVATMTTVPLDTQEMVIA